ncbi:unnamed protein product [Rodentolepis nana]|uniref:Uncharacterized protein n=1 Tax=Rodentolepis nana TaxID=102285 RepID=A0A3P7VCD3_RODNA|nr:unnamed protein product [Rodentolepis nana]
MFFTIQLSIDNKDLLVLFLQLDQKASKLPWIVAVSIRARDVSRGGFSGGVATAVA